MLAESLGNEKKILVINDTKGENKINKIPATLIDGDGIGPEITEATINVLDALEGTI